MTKVLGAPKAQFFRFNSLKFASNGKVYTYKANTTTLKDSYPSVDDANNSTNANDNPVILDARGEADIVIKGPTRVVVTDSDDNVLEIIDDLDSDNANVLDANGNELLLFESLPNAVNYLTMSNATTGNPPILEAKGSDTNVGIGLQTRGTGDITLVDEDITITSGNITISAGNTTITAGDMILTSGDVNMTSGTLILGDVTATFGDLPAGVVTWYGGTSAPSGWLECDGSEVSRTTYSALYAVVGDTFGNGNGSTTFNLPNQERRVIVGKDGTGTGTLGNSIGDTGGSETHTLTTGEIPNHTHTYDLYSTVGDGSYGAVNGNVRSGGSEDITSETVGSDTAHNIMQPSLVSILIIRAY